MNGNNGMDIDSNDNNLNDGDYKNNGDDDIMIENEHGSLQRKRSYHDCRRHVAL